MIRKSIVYSLGILLMVICVLLSGCNSALTSKPNESSSSSTPSEGNVTTALGVESISKDDFDVYYKGITLNEKTLLEELSWLNIPIGEDNENIMIRAGGWNNDMNYDWYQVSYPNRDDEEFVFDYLYNVTLETGYIVSIDLKNVPTKRGIVVGDTLEKIKIAYGNDVISKPNTETTNYIDLIFDNNTLCFIYEKSSGKILSIYIDYDSNKAMEEMDIPGFGP